MRQQGTGITAYVGLWGSGKTLALCEECIRMEAAGAEVYTNFGFRGGRVIETFDDLIRICAEPTRVRRHIALDELGMLLPAREFTKYPPALNIIFMQGRKFGISISYTTQSFAFVDANVRRVTSLVCNCRGHGRHRVSDRGVKPREWRPAVFSRAWYLGEEYETPSRRSRLAFELRRFPQAAADRFDTFALISSAQAALTAQAAHIAKSPLPASWSDE